MVDALKRTGLDASLSNGNFTVFAPTDAVFNAWINDLGYADLAALQQGLGTEQFKSIIAYHILRGSNSSADFSSGYYQTMAINSAKDSLHLYLEKGSVLALNADALVIEADLIASNGVIHSLNSINYPRSVYGLIEVNPNYSSLEAAIGLADGNLKATLSDEASTFTLFAPHNEAFDTLVMRTPNVNNLLELIASLGTANLQNLILYHATGSRMLSSGLQTGSVNTLANDGSGGNLQFFINIGSEVRIIDNSANTEDAVLGTRDIIGSNGAVHLIDAVLIGE